MFNETNNPIGVVIKPNINYPKEIFKTKKIPN